MSEFADRLNIGLTLVLLRHVSPVFDTISLQAFLCWYFHSSLMRPASNKAGLYFEFVQRPG